MAAKPKTIDDILATVADDQRAALEKLRKTIKAAAPKAEECISYGLAAFRLDGKPLVAFGATKGHCAFYLMSGSMVAAFENDLKDYDTSKGTVRFPADEPLPATLVRKLVKARIAENAGHLVKSKKPKSAVKKRIAKPVSDDSRPDPAVVAFMQALDHPLKPAIETVRRIILGVSPEIAEGIKWNSPSFRTTEYFGTLNLRQGRVWLILHTGAKVKANAKAGIEIADPTGQLKWLAKDRCVVTFEDAKDIEAKRMALEAILRQWIQLL